MKRIARAAFAVGALFSALGMAGEGARAFDDAQYPDFNGRWVRAPANVPGQLIPPFDQTKPSGLAQETPVTPEYRALWEASIADQYKGGPGTRGATCRGGGIPHAMNLFDPMEVIILPETTYILIDRYNVQRRIFTDGRDWPTDIDPALNGYSIGRWLDPNGGGHYSILEIETRGFRGPRVYDAMSAPLHSDNQSVIKERLYLDSADRNLMHDEITVIDHSLTRPWTVNKLDRRDPNPRPVWVEDDCAESNAWVQIGKESYYLSGERELMPAKKDQPPPDLRYFKQGQR
jgi:hypothetical protein